MIVIIDNYDSFTYNIYQEVARLTDEPVSVVRCDRISLAGLEDMDMSRLIISPGPGRPEEAGISIDAIRHFAGRIPILGVCLGHQAIGAAFGGAIVQAKRICHGIVEDMTLDGRGLFRAVGGQGSFTRYHSLVIEENSLPEELEITARAYDGDIMGVRHKQYDIEGVQFHPESFASKNGEMVIKAFLSYRREPFAVTPVLNALLQGKSMDRHTAELFMEDLTEGLLDERRMSAILTALTAKGPSAEEIAGCAAVLCRKKTPIHVHRELTDIVGTGGDGKHSFNISSLSALVAAACGLAVAKHGNRAVSSSSGAADFYEALDVKIDTSPEKTAQIIEELGFGFLYAPTYHSAMRFAAPVRRLLGVKTIMNLVGPLSNPADAAYHMLGVYEKSLLKPVAHAAGLLGSRHVMVVCSQDGMDEISPCAPTDVVEIRDDGGEKEYVIEPRDYGVPEGIDSGELLGGDARQNVQLAMDVLTGKGRAAIFYAVMLNAAAALYVGGRVETLAAGCRLAREAMENGSVLLLIDRLRDMSHA